MDYWNCFNNKRPLIGAVYLSGAEPAHVVPGHVLHGVAGAVVPVLQHEHGGAVLLRPLVPLAVLQPARARLSLPADKQESQAGSAITAEYRIEFASLSFLKNKPFC